MTPAAPRSFTKMDGSHFSFYIGKDMSWTDSVLDKL